MISASLYQQRLAQLILERQGISAIWDLQVTAVAAYAAEKVDLAAILLEIADTLEQKLQKCEAGGRCY